MTDPAQEATLERSFYDRSPLLVAPGLLGKVLIATEGRRARITEVEAYGGTPDPASHAFRGRTARNAVMWGPAGHLYVYFSYGVHWCANTTCGAHDIVGAVLLRAAEPIDGLDAMRRDRWRDQRRQVDRDLCRGPGRLCQAFGINRDVNGVDLVDSEGGIRIVDDGAPPPEIARTPRIGISVAADRLWRFAVAGSPWVSGR